MQDTTPNLEAIVGDSNVKRWLARKFDALHGPLRKDYEALGRPLLWGEISRSPKHLAYIVGAGTLVGWTPAPVQNRITTYLGLPPNALTVGDIPASIGGVVEGAAWVYGSHQLSHAIPIVHDGLLKTLTDSLHIAPALIQGLGSWKMFSNAGFFLPRFGYSIAKEKAVGSASGITGLVNAAYFVAKETNRAVQWADRDVAIIADEVREVASGYLQRTRIGFGVLGEQLNGSVSAGFSRVYNSVRDFGD